jgi:ABC-type transport system involved in multi-copper enzyme maturation permease subunit
MFRDLLKRQIVEDLLSFRFLLNFILIIVTVIVFALIFIVHFRNVQLDYASTSLENQQRFAQFSKSPQGGAAFANQELWMKPRAEKFLSFGLEDRIPQGLYFRMSPYELRLLNKKEDITGRGWYLPVSRRESVTTPAFFSPDLASIIQFLFSFLAIALAFNAITGNKEEGSLRLVLSNATKRTHVLMSKYLSALLTLCLPLLVSTIVGLLLIETSGMIQLPGEFFPEVIAFLLTSLLYVSTFILIGLLCSVLCQSSTKSLVLGLLLWIFLVFIFPKSLGLFLNLRRFEVPSPEQIEKQADDLAAGIGDRYFKKENLSLITDENRRIEVILKCMQEEDEAKQKLRDSYLQKKMASVLSLRKITIASPSSLFEYTSSLLAGTGMSHFQHLSSQAKLYAAEVISAVKNRAGAQQDPSPFFLNFRVMTDKPIDPSVLPNFEDKSIPFRERLKDALPYLSLLALYNLFLAIFVFYKFQSYDVR